MKFDHKVKLDGVVYPIGAEVPIGGEPVDENAENMTARLKVLDDAVMARNSEISALTKEKEELTSENAELKARIKELQKQIVPTETPKDSDDTATGEKPVKKQASKSTK